MKFCDQHFFQWKKESFIQCLFRWNCSCDSRHGSLKNIRNEKKKKKVRNNQNNIHWTKRKKIIYNTGSLTLRNRSWTVNGVLHSLKSLCVKNKLKIRELNKEQRVKCRSTLEFQLHFDLTQRKVLCSEYRFETGF